MCVFILCRVVREILKIGNVSFRSATHTQSHSNNHIPILPYSIPGSIDCAESAGRDTVVG